MNKVNAVISMKSQTGLAPEVLALVKGPRTKVERARKEKGKEEKARETKLLLEHQEDPFHVISILSQIVRMVIHVSLNTGRT